MVSLNLLKGRINSKGNIFHFRLHNISGVARVYKVGDKLSAKSANNLEGPGAWSPGKILKFRGYEMPFRAFWGEILENSEDYNIIKCDLAQENIC